MVSATLLLGAAFACTKPAQGPVTPDPVDDGRVHPDQTTLLELFNNKIEEYGNDASVPTNHIYIVGHRANTYASTTGQIPNNSIPNIEMAIEKGLDMIEIDVRVTKDGVPMLMHNATVDATTTGSGNIKDMTYDQVRALNMKYEKAKRTEPYSFNGQYAKVPTLVEALKVTKGKIYVNLDVKDCPVTTLMSALREADVIEEVMIYGPSNTEKQECILWAAENTSKLVAVHPYIGKPSDVSNYAKGYYDCAKLFQYGYNVYYNKTIEGFGYQCHALGALSYSNSLDKDSEILSWYNNYYKKGIEGPCPVLDKFIESGSDFVQTDYFELVDLYLKQKGLR